MKTPEEIKRALRLCRMDEIECKQCAYEIDCKEGMGKQIDHDALELIETQEARIAELEKQLAAAIEDMKRVSIEEYGFLCAVCAHRLPDEEAMEACEMHDYDCDECTLECACREFRNSSGFEWRGLCAENGGKK